MAMSCFFGFCLQLCIYIYRCTYRKRSLEQLQCATLIGSPKCSRQGPKHEMLFFTACLMDWALLHPTAVQKLAPGWNDFQQRYGANGNSSNKQQDLLQGSLYYQPKQCILKGKSHNSTINLHCLIPPKWEMIPVLTLAFWYDNSSVPSHAIKLSSLCHCFGQARTRLTSWVLKGKCQRETGSGSIVIVTNLKEYTPQKLTFSPLKMVVSNRNLQTSRGPLFSGVNSLSVSGRVHVKGNHKYLKHLPPQHRKDVPKTSILIRENFSEVPHSQHHCFQNWSLEVLLRNLQSGPIVVNGVMGPL